MGWLDTFGAVANAFGSSRPQSKGYTTWDTKLRQYGFGSSAGSGLTGTGPSWSDLASGRITGTPPKAKPGPAGFPERINATIPYSANQPSAPTPPHSTQGDLFGSILGAVGSTVGNLNLGNAVPWFMERVHTLANEAAASHVPGVEQLGQAAKLPLDVFSEGVKAAAGVVGPVLDAFPNWVRDGQLHDRAKLYRAIATGSQADFGIGGPVSNPLGTIAQYLPILAGAGMVPQAGAPSPMTDIFGSPVSAQNAQYQRYQQMILHSADPNGRASAEQRLSLLRESIDIPQSVKIAIERDPNISDQSLEELLGKAPEGRAWSYQAGIPGVVQNMATPLLFYGAEAGGISGLAGGARGLGAGLQGGERAIGLLDAVRGGGSAAQYAGSVIGRGGQALSVAASLQKYAMVSGLATTAVTTTLDAINRTMGNQAAVDWFDRVNKSSIYSDDPNVQLMTGFSVNPIDAVRTTVRGGKAGVAGAAKVVSLPLAKGLGAIPITAKLGARMTTFVSSDSTMLAMIQKMYNLHSQAEASAFVDQHYEHRGQAFDEVLGVALEETVSRLPDQEKALLNATYSDPIARTKYVVSTYGDAAMTLLEKDPGAVAARWQAKSWGYHNFPGPFNPEVAAANARDIRIAKSRTYDIRSEMDAVVGYREFLPPQAQALAHSWLDRVTGTDGTVAVAGSNGVQDLIRQFPAMRKYWSGLITNETHVPRATVEKMIQRAEADWQQTSKQNPVRARTGADPILRPDSPTLTRDTAEALGTTQETLNAIDDPSPTADGFSAIRRFITEKTATTPEAAAKMTDAEVVQTAQQYVAETTQPWRDLGATVVSAEKQIVGVRAELARLRAMPKYAAQHDELIRKERELGALNTLIRAASDPLVPFVRSVANEKPGARLEGRSLHLTELAVRRAEATTRLNELATIHDAGASLAGDNWHTLFSIVQGEALYSGGLPPMSTAMRRALRYPQMGDFEAWQTLGNQLSEVEHRLTRAQRNRAHQVLDDGKWRRASPDQTIRGADVIGGNLEYDAIERLASLWSERRGILGGTSEYALRRTADLNLPNEYIALADEMVQNGTTERALINDPRYERVIHPANVAALQDALASPDTFAAAQEIVATDPVLTERLLAHLKDEGMLVFGGSVPESAFDLGLVSGGDRSIQFGTTFDLWGNPAEAGMLRDALIPKDFVRPTPGVLVPDGIWDKAILGKDQGALEQLARDLKLDETPTPPTPTPAATARKAATKVPGARPSARYMRKLAEADGTAAPDPAILEAPGNRIGLDVLSVMNHGIAGTKPATINGVVTLLREIENGNARRAGIGPDLAAEAQRVANEILDAAVRDAPRTETAGIFTKGVFPDDEMKLAGEIDHLLTYDEGNPLATLQYGLKKRPKAAVVLEWSKVPGLAEELMSGRFMPYEERVLNTHAREAFNYVFGSRSNAAIRAEAQVRFLERTTAAGVEGTVAQAIHDAWRKMANESRTPSLRKTPTGERRYVSGDNPLYADIHNIPNASLDAVAHQTINELLDRGKIDNSNGYVQALHKVDFAALFRESTSFTRRTLADNGGTLGQHLATAYGMAVHNKAVTTAYYWFRFGLDIRYHAMNYLEAQILAFGRAGLRKGEVSQGYLGQTEQYLRNLDSDPMSNTGYQFSQDRSAMAYKVFVKEQPDALRESLKGLQAEDPAFMQSALDQLAQHDPQIADMRAQFGDDPAKYLTELDAWHAKMLSNVSMDESAAIIDQTLADEMRKSPELGQLYARLGEVNKGLWADIRGTFYGNPDRSRAERFLNSYLLFWPLSYQIKATKWFAKVMFDRAGGLPTNAAGAVLFDRMATTHQQLLATDPEYKTWFEKHPTLVFMAQMMFPVSLDSMGVSLNPAMRSLFFGRNKAIWDIGPVYTFNHVVPQVGKEVYTDLYPLLKDVPGFDGLYRTLTGKQEPKAPAPPPPPPPPGDLTAQP